MRKNPYIILGIGRRADRSDIKRAYRRAAKESHPDIASRTEQGRFCDVQEAYETLIDEKLRRKCDEELRRDERRRHRSPGWLRFDLSPAGSGIEPLIPPRRKRMPRPYAPSEFGLEVILGAAEVQAGGSFPVRMPIRILCPECRGLSPWVLLCPACDGFGQSWRTAAFTIRFPPGIEDGTRIRLDLSRHGAAGVVHLLFRIDPSAA